MRILVAGGREYNNRGLIATICEGALIRSMQRNDPALTVINGLAKGADSIADQWARVKILCNFVLRFQHHSVYPVFLEGYAADWENHHKAAGPIRNKRMLDEGKPDIVYAFSNDITNSKGTANMITQSKKAKVPTVLISESFVSDSESIGGSQLALL